MASSIRRCLALRARLPEGGKGVAAAGRHLFRPNQLLRHVSSSPPSQAASPSVATCQQRTLPPPPAAGPSEAAEPTQPSTSDHDSSVTINYRGRQFQAPRGTKLRTAMLLHGGVSPHNDKARAINCRGLGTCGTCAVEISGEVSPASWSTAEQLRLNFPPHKPPNNQRLRLACQVACISDLAVVKRDRFWGQGDNVLPDLPPADSAAAGGEAAASVMPLGQTLELLLDPGAFDVKDRSKKSS